MISKFTYGKPFKTEAVVMNIKPSGSLPGFISISDDKLNMTIHMNNDDVIYGLGENVRGINKRGYRYISNCSDDFSHTEDKSSLYAAHNFFILDGAVKFGLFIDFPGKVCFDAGFSDMDLINISIEEADYDLYIIEGSSVSGIIKEFRQMIGKSYIAPLWAFGYQQSRWSYNTADEVREVVRKYREAHIPLDAVYLDIDYMDSYKDFTINNENFPDFKDFINEMKSQGIRLIPIIDAAVKVEKGYGIYEEGASCNYFCKDDSGNDFITAVWPGKSVLPDFLNSKSREWFGSKYKLLTDMGIDGFWNDMNEPALFYSEKNLKKTMESLKDYIDKDMSLYDLWNFKDMVNGLANNPDDYRSFYHDFDGEKVRHDKVHNIYGYFMTKAASDAFKTIASDRRILIFSRASYIGMHRYSGIWTGDNSSWWSHIELLMHQLPGINMCGFMYVGADTGGFNQNVSEDLMMRFIELSMFTPLMRNHSALGTRAQELYNFKNVDDFRNLVTLRYGMIPYLYSEYLKSIRDDTLMFTPLGIAFPEDNECRHIEDQLLVGESIMIAPVYKQNAVGRYVYLPEDMTLIRFRSLSDYDTITMKQGHHYVDAALNEVLVFIRKDHIFITGKGAENTGMLTNNEFVFYGQKGLDGEYELLNDIDKSVFITVKI